MLNELVDILEKESSTVKDGSDTSSEKIANGPTNGLTNGVHKEPLVTWVHKNFQVMLRINCSSAVFLGYPVFEGLGVWVLLGAVKQLQIEKNNNGFC